MCYVLRLMTHCVSEDEANKRGKTTSQGVALLPLPAIADLPHGWNTRNESTLNSCSTQVAALYTFASSVAVQGQREPRPPTFASSSSSSDVEGSNFECGRSIEVER